MNNRVRHTSTPEVEFFVKTLCKRPPRRGKQRRFAFYRGKHPNLWENVYPLYVLNGLGTILTKNGLNRRFLYKPQTTQKVLDTWFVDQNRTAAAAASTRPDAPPLSRYRDARRSMSSSPAGPCTLNLEPDSRIFYAVQKEIENHAMRGNGSLILRGIGGGGIHFYLRI